MEIVSLKTAVYLHNWVFDKKLISEIDSYNFTRSLPKDLWIGIIDKKYKGNGLRHHYNSL